MGQSTVFSQVIKLIPRLKFESIVARHNGNKGVRSLDCWSWFGALLFGQLTGHDSIRAIERVFAHSDPQMKKLGFGPVRRSTLADANCNRPVEILEDLYHYTLGEANRVAPSRNGFRFKGDVFALDSTTIQLCLSLCPWAQFHHGKGAVKLHTAIDIAGDLPQFAVITEGRKHDMAAIKNEIFFPPKSTVVCDRAYVDYVWLNSLNQSNVYFVTRCKVNCKFKVVKSCKTNRTRGHICDQVIYLKSIRGKVYKGKLRRITYRNPDTGKRLSFLTNRFDLATQTICDLYKARWKVELFFKTLKQNLRIKKFLGTSYNAVKAQILVALISYLLIQILRYSLKTSISIPDAMAVIGTLLLLREPLKRLLGDLPAVTRHPPPLQLSLF
ncbi:MAG: IS4 family transposase [Bacteriovoracaceae bacterium]|nr:IS4 family transposase [Bacteriovoracaceae bacterium]